MKTKDMIKLTFKILIAVLILAGALFAYNQYSDSDITLNGITGKTIAELPETIDDAKEGIENLNDGINEGIDKMNDVNDALNGDDAEIKADEEDELSLTEKLKNTLDDALGIVSTNEQLESILELRTESIKQNTIGLAKKISELESVLGDSKEANVRKNWENILGCVYIACQDKDYISLIDSVALTKKNDKNVAIHSLIETYEFWNSNNVVYFSESLTQTDELIEKLDQEEISVMWQDIVDCNAKCQNFEEQIILTIKEINLLA